jgi:two-component system cell cycle response regulator
MVSANPRFDELKTTGKLPSPSGVALAIIELCRKDGASIDEIAHAVRADPALSGRIIKFANAAANAPRRPIVSVPEAIQLVGINTVRQLVLGFSLLGQYRNGACAAFDYSRYWSRSLAVAIAASALCLRVRSAPPDEAFTCGLLSDVGTLALATIYPDEYAELVAVQPPPSVQEMARVERERFATDHNELGAALLADWHLPRLFVVSVFHHEAPEQARLPEGSREFIICQVLHLAARLGDLCVSPEPARAHLLPDLILGAAKVGLDEAALSKLTEEVTVQWREWGKILEVHTQAVPAFETISQQKTAAPVMREPDKLPDPRTVQSLTVLIVDDDRATLMLVEHLLKALGHKVHTAQDGRSALAQAMSIRPQIIISDWIMPGLDGVSFCKALRQTEEGQQIYFIILSALEQDDQLVEAFEAGVDDYLTKPFTARVLAARLRAGQRVIKLQEDARRDSENLRRFAAELAVANRRLQQAALTDPLTGLPNRRYAMERLEQEWASTSRTQRPLTCMVVDVDQFKQINDSYGHDSGDVVLRQVATVLRKEARAEDVICRLGGEEFLVICPDTPLGAALHLAERLRLGVARARAANGAINHTATVSIGVCQREAAMTRMDELIKAADNALYDAKRAGRNRVAVPRAPSATASAT